MQEWKPGVVDVSVAAVVVVVPVFAVAVVVVGLGATSAINNKQMNFSSHCFLRNHVQGKHWNHQLNPATMNRD